MHLDHSGGLPGILEQTIKYRKKYPDIDPAVRLPDPKAEPIIRSWIGINSVPNVQSLDIQTYREGVFYDDGFVRMEAFPTKHLEWAAKDPELKSYSFRITAENRRVLFTGDLCGDFSDFPFDAASGSDLLVSELVHFPIEKAYEHLKNLKIGRLIFNHLANRWQDPKEIPYALELFQSVPYPVEFSRDGMSIEI
jgi:ribonuclease BN (tRNA processing enzyme)